MSQVAIFKMPSGLLGSGLENEPPDDVSDDRFPLDEDLERDPTPSETPLKGPEGDGLRCPICSEVVDQDIFDGYSQKTTMSFDQQMKFCASHRKHAAQKAWAIKGYPDINWRALDSRMTACDGHLRTVLGGENSHFRDRLSQKVMAGKDRTLKKSDDRLIPGYYGLRGLRSMSDHIIRKFSTLLRKQAVQDQLISARGSTCFVQAVLVPELAVKLIMADLDICASKAREVLYESIPLGELLNEDVADVVLKDMESDAEEGHESLSQFSEGD